LLARLAISHKKTGVLMKLHRDTYWLYPYIRSLAMSACPSKTVGRPELILQPLYAVRLIAFHRITGGIPRWGRTSYNFTSNRHEECLSNSREKEFTL
jgi:hypothetical protein